MSEQELDSHNSIRLNRQETQLMSYFMLNENKELSTEELLTHVWKNDEDVNSEMVWIYVSYLRQKLQSIQSSIHIEGEKGGSYQLIKLGETMIQKFRWKFIGAAIGALFLVLILTLGSLIAVSYAQNQKEIDRFLTALVKNQGHLSPRNARPAFGDQNDPINRNFLAGKYNSETIY